MIHAVDHGPPAPADDEPPMGSVIKFTKDHGGKQGAKKRYIYIAYKPNKATGPDHGTWFVTGKTSNYTWDELKSYMQWRETHHVSWHLIHTVRTESS